MSDLADIVQFELERTKAELIRNYESLGLRASGEYAEALEVFVEDGDTVHAGILGAEHSYYMENGRGPNKRQDRGMIAFMYVKILKWMEVKGITDLNPWLVARKIVREGIKVPNRYNPGGVISDVINDDWEEEFLGNVAEGMNHSYNEMIMREFKTMAQ